MPMFACEEHFIELFGDLTSVVVSDLDAKPTGFPFCNNTHPRPYFEASFGVVIGLLWSKYASTGALVIRILILIESNLFGLLP